jgi:hypothetical protein
MQAAVGQATEYQQKVIFAAAPFYPFVEIEGNVFCKYASIGVCMCKSVLFSVVGVLSCVCVSS